MLQVCACARTCVSELVWVPVRVIVSMRLAVCACVSKRARVCVVVCAERPASGGGADRQPYFVALQRLTNQYVNSYENECVWSVHVRGYV